jgi:hypothetical protein
MVRSPGFGSNRTHYVGLFSLAFTVPPSNDLGLHVRLTRWIVLQKARSHPEGLLLLVRIQFQVLFHSPSGVLFAFPSRYLFTIDRKSYLALEGGPPSFSQGFTCPDLLDVYPPDCSEVYGKYKVSETWHTRLSLSMANPSRLFCSLRYFVKPYAHSWQHVRAKPMPLQVE